MFRLVETDEESCWTDLSDGLVVKRLVSRSILESSFAGGKSVKTLKVVVAWWTIDGILLENFVVFENLSGCFGSVERKHSVDRVEGVGSW